MAKNRLSTTEKRLLKNLKQRIRYSQSRGYKVDKRLEKWLNSKSLNEEKLRKYTTEFEKYVKYRLLQPETGELVEVSKKEARTGKSKKYPQAERIVIQRATRLLKKTLEELLQASKSTILPSTSRRWDMEREHMMNMLSNRLEELANKEYTVELAQAIEDNSFVINDTLSKLIYSSSQRDNIYSVKSAYEYVMNLLGTLLGIQIEGIIPTVEEIDFGEE